MNRCRVRASVMLAFAGTLSVVLAPSAAGAYPDKPVRVILPMPPGGGTDFVGRVVLSQLAARLGQQMIPDNRAGAGSVIGTELAAKASPDGYTLLFAAGSFTTQPALQKLPYDPLKSFIVIAVVGRMNGSLLAHPGIAASSTAELIALAKKRPGQLNFATSGLGSNAHFGTEIFRKMAGIDILIVHYRGGGGPARIAMLGGHSDAMFGTMEGLDLVKAGRLKLLATCGTQRSALAPDVPTLAETLPGYELSQTYQLLAPAGTPAAVVAQLARELESVMRSETVAKQLLVQGVEKDFVGRTAAAELLAKEIGKWTRLAREASIRIEQ